VTTWTAAQVRTARARAQLLGSSRADGVAAVLARVVAVQSQDVRPARLAVRARSAGLAAADVDTACATGAAVRTWLMRGTLHMVATADVRWLLRIFGARNAAGAAGRRRRLGLSDDLCDRALAALPQVLAAGPRTRAEVVAGLADAGVAIDGSGQAPAHLLLLAASRGVVCRGPEAGRDEPTYVLLDEWVPADPPAADVGPRADRIAAAVADRPASGPPADLPAARPDDPTDAGLGLLAARYVAGHGPVAPTDLAGWSGLPLGMARRAFAAADLAEIPTELGPLSVAPGRADPPDPGPAAVHLLGHFDGYLLGYRDRALSVDPAHDRAVQTGGGFVMPTVVVDGRAVATWRTAQQRVSVTPFATLSAAIAEGIDAEVADVARFLDRPVRWDR
jgi:Winged helix DNA-binding domain